MTSYYAAIVYAGPGVSAIHVEDGRKLVAVLHPTVECDDWRDAVSTLRESGWLVVGKPADGALTFPVTRH